MGAHGCGNHHRVMIAVERRRGMGGKAEEPLPEGVVPIAYLGSSGTQYIDTGIIYDSSKETTVSCGVTIRNNGTVTLNGWDAGGAFGQLIGKPTNGDGNSFGISIYNIYCDTELLIRAATNTQTTLKVTINGTSYSRNRAHGSLGTYANGQGYKLFACQSQSSVKYHISEDIYYCKIWQGGNLVRNYIPVKKDGVGYLYDKVSKTLFANSGSGSFIIGE